MILAMAECLERDLKFTVPPESASGRRLWAIRIAVCLALYRHAAASTTLACLGFGCEEMYFS